MQALLRDQATPSRPVYQVHPSWAVKGGLKGVALCCRSQEHSRGSRNYTFTPYTHLHGVTGVQGYLSLTDIYYTQTLIAFGSKIHSRSTHTWISKVVWFHKELGKYTSLNTHCSPNKSREGGAWYFICTSRCVPLRRGFPQGPWKKNLAGWFFKKIFPGGPY